MAYLRETTKANIYGVPTEGFPIILSEKYKVDWLSLEYFLDLYRDGVSVSSIGTYGGHLVDLMSQLEVEEETGIDDITDGWIRSYKEEIKKRLNTSGRPNTESYASQIIRSAVHYLYWLETNRYIHGVIGAGKNYKVRVTETGKGIKHPEAKDKSIDKRKTVTPRKDWIEIVKTFGPKRDDLALRYELMIEWGMILGLRAMEICNLTVDLLPEQETAVKAIRDKKNTFVRLRKTKGGKPANIPVSPLLIKKTWDYIYSDRSVVVEKFAKMAKQKYSTYKEPKGIFLSDKTGESLNPRAFSNSIRTAFLRAVDAGELTMDERVWTHGLRHNFTSSLLKNFDKNGVRRPEAVARHVTRHGSEDAMEPYLTDRFNEDFDG